MASKKVVIKRFKAPVGAWVNGGYYAPGAEFDYDVTNCPDGLVNPDWIEVPGAVQTQTEGE